MALIKIHDYLASAQADLINRNKDKILAAISDEMIQDAEYYQYEYESMSLDLLNNPEHIKLDVRGHEIKLSQLTSYIDIEDWGTDRYGKSACYRGSVGDIEFNDDLRSWAKILGFNRLHNIIKRLNKAGYHLEASYSLYLVDSEDTSTYIRIDSGELYDLVDELKENFNEAIHEAYTSYLDSRWSSIEEYFYSNERAQDIFDFKDNAELLEYLN